MLNNSKKSTAGSPGVRKTLRGLAGMASALALVGAIGVGLNSTADAAVITSQMGIPAPEGGIEEGGCHEDDCVRRLDAVVVGNARSFRPPSISRSEP